MTDQNNAAHDLGTSSGGRAYIADYFATQLRRHDLARYINSTLAADFACALAQHLSKLRAEGVQAGDERSKFEASYRSRFHVPAHAALTFPDVQEAWEWWQARAALASAPIAGEAQPVCWIYRTHLESLRDDGADEASAYWGEAGRAIGPDEVPLYAAPQASEAVCSCPTGDGSLRHPCAVHPPGEKDGGHESDQAPPQSPPQNRTEALHG